MWINLTDFTVNGGGGSKPKGDLLNDLSYIKFKIW